MFKGWQRAGSGIKQQLARAFSWIDWVSIEGPARKCFTFLMNSPVWHSHCPHLAWWVGIQTSSILGSLFQAAIGAMLPVTAYCLSKTLCDSDEQKIQLFLIATVSLGFQVCGKIRPTVSLELFSNSYLIWREVYAILLKNMVDFVPSA